MVELAFKKNPHGGGVAWREYDEKHKTMLVHWKKGLNVEEMVKLVANVPLPAVFHFRISSNEKPPKLMFCHPFPIEKTAPTWLAGNTGGNVLFHNGHWGDWKKNMLEGAKSFGVRLPEGKMSDTRAMAFLCALYGDQYMELIEEKGISFGPTDAETQFFWGSGWCQIDGVWCSNSAFMNTTIRSNDVTGASVVGFHGAGHYTSGRKQCQETKCYVWHDNENGFCDKHNPERPQLPDGETKKEAAGNGSARPEVVVEKTEGTGGSSTLTPFDRVRQIEENLQKGVPGKGRRALKRAQRLYESTLNREARLNLGLSKRQDKLRRKNQKFPEMVKSTQPINQPALSLPTVH
jgi:hypothetical protein